MKRGKSWIFPYVVTFVVVIGEFIFGYTLAKSDAQQQITVLKRQQNGLTAEGVCNNRMYEFYGAYASEPEALTLKTDADFRDLCQKNYPQAIYPSTEWTPEAVVQSYYDQPEIWGYFQRYTGARSFYFTWTSDYQHCFILDTYTYEDEMAPLQSGWLCVDGIRVHPLYASEKIVDDISPEHLIQAYQAGDWDGHQLVSSDLSTTVYVDGYEGGELSYTYSAWRYGKDFDPDGIAYAGFDALPWWRSSNVDVRDLALLDSNSDGKALWQDGRVSAFDYVDYKLYADLPADFDWRIFTSMSQNSKLGTLCLAPGEVYLFNKGRVIGYWEFEAVDQKTMKLYYPTNNDALGVLYDGQDLWTLYANGKKELAFEQIVYADPENNRFWVITDKTLYRASFGEHHFADSPEILSENVDDVYVSDNGLWAPDLIVIKSDGSYVVNATGSNNSEHYLGPESPEYYIKIHQSFSFRND